MTTDLTKPTIHLNGTGAASLLAGYERAGTAVRDALGAVCAAAPNARDYYVQGDGAFERARREHESRTKRLRAVAAELELLAEHVDVETARFPHHTR